MAEEGVQVSPIVVLKVCSGRGVTRHASALASKIVWNDKGEPREDEGKITPY